MQLLVVLVLVDKDININIIIWMVFGDDDDDHNLSFAFYHFPSYEIPSLSSFLLFTAPLNLYTFSLLKHSSSERRS